MQKVTQSLKDPAPPVGPKTIWFATMTDMLIASAHLADIENHLQKAMDNHLDGDWAGTHRNLQAALHSLKLVSPQFRNEVLAKRLADIGAMAPAQPLKVNHVTSLSTEMQLELSLPKSSERVAKTSLG